MADKRAELADLTRRTILSLAGASLTTALSSAAEDRLKDTGYRGIWYQNQPTKDRYAYKYSGGFATYPQQHAPIAIYAKEADKTFFCYGGTVEGKQELLHMVSYFDHKTRMVPRPTVLLNKHTEDAHDNPTISIDGKGHIWIFSSAHGTTRPSYIHRSEKPYSIDRFELVLKTNFSYTQPWYLPGNGFLFLHTRYRPVKPSGSGRALFQMTSPDGYAWSEPKQLAFTQQGHYQVSWPNGDMLGMAFDIHPTPVGLNARTNLYYMETRDFGATWVDASGETVQTPIAEERNAALVHDYHAEGLLVYIKDLQYDAAGRPVIVFETSKGFEPGPDNGPRVVRVARWSGREWLISTMMEADHNYDHGSLYLEKDGRRWRYISPSGAGPQPWGTGGEVEVWESRDMGATWKRRAALTKNSRYNHTYVRRPLHAHKDFYALWADGSPLEPTVSRLYFANAKGKVFRLPDRMESELARPERVR